MSNSSVKQSPKSSSCSGVSKTRSISDIIQSLKTAFLDADYKTAERELMEREGDLRREKEEIVVSLREKSDILEAELRDLKIKKLLREEEGRRLKLDLDLKDVKLNDLERELNFVKGNAENANMMCDLLRDDIRKMESEEGKFIQDLSDMSDMVDELKRKLRKKEEMDELVREKDALLEELEGVWRKNSCLEEEKMKFDAHLEELKREKEERIEELLKRIEVEKRQVEARQEELEGLQKKNTSLEEQKVESDARVEVLWRSNEEKNEKIKKLTKEVEVLEKEKDYIVKEKDEQIQELKKEKEGLGEEKRELAVKLGLVEERFLKLEADAITCLCLDLGRDKRFASTHVGKILSGIIKALDSEEVGLTCNAGVVYDPQEADSDFASHINEPKCSMMSDKESLDAVKWTLDFEAEFSRDRATGNKKTTFDNPIIVDSDDDDENLLHVDSVKKKRQCPGSLSEQLNHDDSLILTHKMKKLKHVPYEPVKQESSLAALSTIRSDHLFNTSQRHTLPTLKKCEENPRREDNGPRCCLLKDDDRKADTSKYNLGTPKTDKLCSPQVEEYLTANRQRMQNKRLECAADMIRAFDQDGDFCAKAVCALYRLQKSWLSGIDGSACLRSKGFAECDIERVTALAKILIDGDPSGKMKKPVSALQEHDLKDCRKLAIKYSKQLIGVYKKIEDPLFSPLSTDLQYK